MIKIKLSDNQNMKCFSGFIHTKNLLKDYSIDLTKKVLLTQGHLTLKGLSTEIQEIDIAISL